MIRNIGAVVVGLVAGMAVNMAIGALAWVFYPMPEGVGFSDAEGVAAYMAALPMAAFLIVLAAHLSQAFVGGWVAARISPNQPMVVAMIIGTLTLVGGVVNMKSIPMPTWMMVEFPLYLVVAWAAARMEINRRGGKGLDEILSDWGF